MRRTFACFTSTRATRSRYSGVVVHPSSTVTAVFFGNFALNHDVMVPPPEIWMSDVGSPKFRANHLVTHRSPPEKSTDDNGWCNEITVRGSTRLKNRSIARVSGSDAGRGPLQYRVPLP